MVTCSKWSIRKPFDRLNIHVETISCSRIPRNYSQSFQDLNWLNSMKDIYDALISKGTWVLVSQPSNANVVNCIWLLEKKLNTYGSLARYKAHLAANGRRQRLGIDCYETFSPIVKPTIIQAILNLVVSHHGMFIN
ncbi:hypothetical protein Lser_V15G11814 [Lactuca serriola]